MPSLSFVQTLSRTAFALTLVSCSLEISTDPVNTMPESAVAPIPAFATPFGNPDGATTYTAAAAFMAALSASQRSTLILPIDSALRRNWSNLPAGIVDFERNGLRLGDLQPDQLSALFTFLAAGLGAHGYDTIGQVIAAEAVLSESFLASRLKWSATNYWLGFFGEPTADGAWGWQFGGHHLAINASLDGGRIVSLSPTFIGIEPASFDFQGQRHAPLADELADGRALMRALPQDARAQTLVDDRPREVYAGPGEDGVIPPDEGGSVADWPDEARGMLLDIVSHWLRLQPEENGIPRLAAIESGLGETRFAWHGAVDGDGDVYYRIQGPTLIIEFSSEGGVGADGGHYHSVYRDPTNEYGGALL